MIFARTPAECYPLHQSELRQRAIAFMAAARSARDAVYRCKAVVTNKVKHIRIVNHIIILAASKQATLLQAQLREVEHDIIYTEGHLVRQRAHRDSLTAGIEAFDRDVTTAAVRLKTGE